MNLGPGCITRQDHLKIQNSSLKAKCNGTQLKSSTMELTQEESDFQGCAESSSHCPAPPVLLLTGRGKGQYFKEKFILEEESKTVDNHYQNRL